MAQGDDMGGSGSAGGDAGIERARATLRAGNAFRPRTLEGSESGMSRLADRWAPEGIGALRQPSLRALSFVDHLLVPQRTFAEAAAGRAQGGEATASGSAWWMFPVPWFGGAEAQRGAHGEWPEAGASVRAKAAHDAEVAMGRRPLPPPAADMPVVAPLRDARAHGHRSGRLHARRAVVLGGCDALGCGAVGAAGRAWRAGRSGLGTIV